MFIILAAIAAQAATAKIEYRPQPAQATVSRVGSRWRIEYSLNRKAEAWVFPVSAPTLADHAPWRPRSWRVKTAGARIERRGAYDVLVPTSGRYVPRTVRVEFTPTNMTLDREYDPAVMFSNGSVALYSDQFDVVPTGNPTEIAGKRSGLSVEELGGEHLPVRFHDDAGAVFVLGKKHVDPVLTGAETYVIFGAGDIEKRGDVAVLADPALPEWLKTEMSELAPQVAAAYAARLGNRNDPSLPLLLMGWRGPTPGKVINDGGVRPGLILLNFEGEGLLDRNQRAARRTRWFIAHEMAHFWLGTSGVGYRAPADAWITEGGADVMAFTLLAKSDHDYALAELQRAVDECIKFATKPLAGASDRRESRAFYACGAVFAIAATAATAATRAKGGHDYFDFIRPLLAQHGSDRLLGADDWLSHFRAISQDEVSADIMRTLLEKGSERPAEKVEKLFRRTGVPFSRTGEAITLARTVI